MPVASDTVAAVTTRLRASKRFDSVDVQKRYASLSDPTQVVLHPFEPGVELLGGQSRRRRGGCGRLVGGTPRKLRSHCHRLFPSRAAVHGRLLAKRSFLYRVQIDCFPFHTGPPADSGGTKSNYCNCCDS